MPRLRVVGGVSDVFCGRGDQSGRLWYDCRMPDQRGALVGLAFKIRRDQREQGTAVDEKAAE